MQIRSNQFDLTKPEARALLAHGCDDPTVPHLFVAHFVPASGTAAATDGHRLAVLAADDGVVCDDGAPYSVPRDVLAAAWRACPGEGIISVGLGEIVVHATKELLLFPEPLATLAFQPAPHEFPDVEAVIPAMHHDGLAAPAVGIDPAYVSGLALVGKAVGDEARAVMHVPESATGPVLFVIGEWRVVIMPCDVGVDGEAGE